ncbi:MAG: enoyl-CoA hydratase/isomerase family protein [Sphingobacterium sp.]|uniref:enoyl-CoA hydratase/isomerase family protein n=1 Tax=Sphingobacterium sp. JB170 TaxID=1434842 RepID=UPI000B35888F|nr:enoyl-CoA hydratase/isomerase family protein [Sphingobacterium sp. JB170]
MQYKYIRLTIEQKLATLTLARADKRNAFTPSMIDEIAHAINRINQDPHVNVVLLNAEGPVFCAGMDLKTFEDPELDVLNAGIKHDDRSLGDVMQGLLKPSIAVLQGDVIAGGFLFILGCTYVLAAEHVRFRLPELNLGIFPFQVMASLARVMPQKKVLQLCLDTNYFDVHRAMQLGIVDGIYEQQVVNQKIKYFQEVDVAVVMAGISALNELTAISPSEQYEFLKQRLNALKIKTDNNKLS